MDSFAFEICVTTTEHRVKIIKDTLTLVGIMSAEWRTKPDLFADEFGCCSAEVQWVHTNKA